MTKKVLIGFTTVLLSLVLSIFAYQVVIKPALHKMEAGSKADERNLMLDKARNLMDQGDYDSAIKALEILAVKHPDSQEAEAGFAALESIYEKRNDLVKARELYLKMIDRFPVSKEMPRWQEAAGNLNIKIISSPVITPDSSVYVVQGGDTLGKIAKKFNTTIELIMKSNNMKDSVARLGKRLKITKAKFSIAVDKSQNILTLRSGGNIVKTYNVSTGKDFSTPVGDFTIVNKIENPTWYTANAVVPPGSPDNILGTRWMGISEEGYGIHGTTDPKSIGKQATAGCVRMENSDVEELYSIVPEGTEVAITD